MDIEDLIRALTNESRWLDIRCAKLERIANAARVILDVANTPDAQCPHGVIPRAARWCTACFDELEAALGELDDA